MKMKMKYTEQAVETLDDAGSVIANKNIEIEQLRQQVAEKDEVIAEAGEMLAMRDRQLAALKTELREICVAIDDPACDLTLTTVECIKKLKAENEWQPIETAPKDEFVLLAGPSGYTTIKTVFTTGRMCRDYHAGRWIDHANDDLTDWGFNPPPTGCLYRNRQQWRR